MIPPRCLIVQGHLGRYVDGALRGERAVAVRDHLEVCARCLEAERMARAIPVMLASSLDPPPPPTLLPHLLSRLGRRRRRERRAVSMAALGLLLVLAASALSALR